jgi:nicotinate dehydrogenase subunit B
VTASFTLDRRGFLAGAGALTVSFALHPAAAQEPMGAAPAATAPESFKKAPLVDSWIRIDGSGAITVCTGKAELGQGIRTALVQIAADELDVEPGDIRLLTADTGETPDEGFTAGSQSMQNSGAAIRAAGSHVRLLLVAEAARRFGLAEAGLVAANRQVRAPDGRTLGYGALAGGLDLHVEARADLPTKRPDAFRHVGRSMPRVDIPAKLTGAPAYLHDLRPEGMLHARVVRPPGPGATLVSVDETAAKRLPGVVAVVRDGSFLAVAAEREYQAILAMRALAASARWDEPAALPDMTDIAGTLKGLEREVGTVAASGAPDAFPAGAKTYSARYTRPYTMHGSIGPSVALAHWQGDAVTVWSHTQGVYPDRKAIAAMLRLPPEKVRVIHAAGSGCYGHNGADDAAADAALVARSLPGRPIRLQWTREQENGFEPKGPAMLGEVEAALGADGRITHWRYDVWSNTHSTRPGGAGALLPARELGQPFPLEPAKLEITPAGNGDRNADPLYRLPNKRVLWHFLPDMPVRVSALRALGAYANVFALESSMDDLARLAGADPVAFRLAHLDDPRAKAVVEEAAKRFGWADWQPRPDRGRGFAFARYKNHAAYLALGIEVEVDRSTGRVRVTRAIAAIDSGQAVNPDGIRNQTEGGILQSMSWTLFEEVAFDGKRITSLDWGSYPILRFGSVPDVVEVHIMERPNEPFLGTGEAAQGPTAAAISNAILDATGVRLRDLPLNRARLRAALDRPPSA